MTNEIVLHQSAGFISPVVDVQSALVRLQAMKDFIDNGLQKGRDYDVIPGTAKPTLLKPGAEKLSNFFGLAPRFEIVEKELDWLGSAHEGEPFFYFHYRCRLMKNETLAAEGEGSANSFEKKYRWRTSDLLCPNCEKPAIKKSKFPPRNNPNAQPGWYCHDKAGGCGANFDANDKRITEQARGQVKNPDIADIVNTLQKMGQKRAYVAAVLLAVNGSEYFTQDVEDFVDGTYRVEEITPPAPPAPTNGNGKQAIDTRGLEPELGKPVRRSDVIALEQAEKAASAEANPFDEPEQPKPPKPIADKPKVTRQPVPTFKMTRDEAEAETTKEGVRYGDLDSSDLEAREHGIAAGLRTPGLTLENKENLKRKSMAISVILQAREAEDEASRQAMNE